MVAGEAGEQAEGNKKTGNTKKLERIFGNDEYVHLSGH